MLYTLFVILGTLALLAVALWALASAGRRWPCEGVRKALHVGMALAMLPLPVLLPDLRGVWALAFATAAAMLAVRCVPGLRRRVGDVVHGVTRRSWGDLCFPFGIALACTVAQGDREAYRVAVLALALADPAAALVGGRAGRGLRIPGGYATAAGMAACGAVVFGVALAAGLDAAVAGAVAAMGALIEAATGRGLDNVTLPLGVVLALVGPAWLALTLTGLAGLVLFAAAGCLSAGAASPALEFQP